jgi:hypothetical protein
MKAGMKRKWITALRSGEYEQGAGNLKAKDDEGNVSFCCLGVLRDLYPTVRKARNGMELLSPATCGIPTKVQDKLAEMNDGKGVFYFKPQSFKRIATWIEKHL